MREVQEEAVIEEPSAAPLAVRPPPPSRASSPTSKLGTTAQKGRAPLLLPELRRVCAALPADAQGDRDRALLLIGW